MSIFCRFGNCSKNLMKNVLVIILFLGPFPLESVFINHISGSLKSPGEYSPVTIYPPSMVC